MAWMEARQQNSLLVKRWKHNTEDQEAKGTWVTRSTRSQAVKLLSRMKMEDMLEDGFWVSREAWEDRQVHAELVCKVL